MQKEREIQSTMQHMREVNTSISAASDRLNEAVGLMENRFQQVADGASAQNSRAQETAIAMEEMTSTVHEVAQNASAAAGQTEDARHHHGAQIVDEAVSAIAEVNTHTGVLLKEMESLEVHTEDIGKSWELSLILPTRP